MSFTMTVSVIGCTGRASRNLELAVQARGTAKASTAFRNGYPTHRLKVTGSNPVPETTDTDTPATDAAFGIHHYTPCLVSSLTCNSVLSAWAVSRLLSG